MQHIVATQPAVAASAGITTTQLIVLLLSSSVLAAFLTQGAVWLRDWLAETKNRKFAALYLALALEDYGEMLSDDIMDAENEAAQSQEGRFLFSVRAVPDYPEVDWKALGIKRTVAAMSFRVKVDRIRTQYSAEAEFVDFEDVSIAARISAVELGREAIALGRVFRKEVDLPKRDMVNPLDHFDRVMARHEEVLRKRVAYDAAKNAGSASTGGGADP